MKIDWMSEETRKKYQKNKEEESEMDKAIEEIERYRRREDPLSKPGGYELTSMV